MSIVGKVTPKIYEYLRLTGRTSILQTKPIRNISLKGLKLDTDLLDKVEIKSALCRARYSDDKFEIFGIIPDNYVKKESFFVPGYTKKILFGPQKGQLRTYPEQWLESTIARPHYYIEELWSRGKGSGTRAIQDIVEQSLKDKRTNGRILLTAECIDGATYPAGFYYKLGFRSTNSQYNEALEKWAQCSGTKENVPGIPTTLMYLPKENIEHCLTYGK